MEEGIGNVLNSIIQQQPDGAIISMMNLGNIKADDSDPSPDSSGHTPLHMAARLGNTGLVRIFLDTANVNVNVFNPRVNRDSQTPISGAVNYNHTEVVRLLLKHGASVNDAVFDTTLSRSQMWSPPNSIQTVDLTWMITWEVARTGTRRKLYEWVVDIDAHSRFPIAVVPAMDYRLQRQDEQAAAQEEFSRAGKRVRRWREAAAMQRRVMRGGGNQGVREECITDFNVYGARLWDWPEGEETAGILVGMVAPKSFRNCRI
jgi:hypothetical protein